MDYLKSFEFWISLITGILSLLTFLYVTLGGSLIRKNVKLTTIGPGIVRFKVQQRNFTVQQITNIVSACYYDGGQVPSAVRNEIIQLTAPSGFRNAKANHIVKIPTVLINLSNHPSTIWSEEQLNAAHEYGKVIDIPFPTVDPSADEQTVGSLADEYVAKVLEYAKEDIPAVHVMGEMTLTNAIVRRLHDHGIPCLASTTERVVVDQPDGTKESRFKFVRFRKYE